MSIIFISDLHLDEHHPQITDAFLRFLKRVTKADNTLYILGDFFEVWIGDDNLSPYNLSIIEALQQATAAGLAIFIMHGNRDFLLGKKFLATTGCKLLPDEHVIDVNGTRTLLMHGDTLCIQDIKYLKFRKKARNWFFQQIFLFKSLKKRIQIATDYRAKSQMHVSTLPDHIMDVTQSAVEDIMQKHGVSQLIHGHTHRQAIHQFSLNGKDATRTVLGAWHENGNALICTENQIEFIEIE